MRWVGVVLLAGGVVVSVVVAAVEARRRRRLRAFFAWQAAGEGGLGRLGSVRGALLDGRVGTIALVGVGFALATWWLLDTAVLAAVVLGGTVAVSVGVRLRAVRRSQLLLRAQVADAMASIASSMSAGSSFLHGLQEVARTARPPLGPELEQVLDEIEVGVAPAAAIDALARRTDLVPARWLAHLLRLQELSGSPLAPMLQRLARVVHQDDELQREVQALTAEGRASAYVIAALPVGLVVVLELMQPGYLDEFTSGWGLVVAVGMAASIGVGLFVINRMVRALEGGR